MSEYGDLSLEYVGGCMLMDNLYFHAIDVHVLVCINDSMALHTSDSSAAKKKSGDKQDNAYPIRNKPPSLKHGIL
jgi:hypothetical protein